MSVEWNRFWCRVLFKEFIKHFRKLNDEQIVKDVRQSMDDLEDLVPDTDSFGSQMVRWSLERADEPFAVAARENGKKGGRPRKSITADGDIREDSQDRKSGTSANLYGDAATREGAEVVACRESGVVEPTTISNFSGARESTRTDGHSLRVGNVARPPVRSSLAYAGRGGNVRLTDDEYAMLLQELGNKRKADKLIDSLDYSISEGKTFNAPHFHVLMHWNDYREEKAAEAAEMAKVNADARAEAFSRRGYKTAEERQQEELAKINDFCTGLRNGTIKIAKEG